jgi:uncharacterized membrane protein
MDDEWRFRTVLIIKGPEENGRDNEILSEMGLHVIPYPWFLSFCVHLSFWCFYQIFEVDGAYN